MDETPATPAPRSRWRSFAPWLLLIPFVALLYPPLYAREHPRVAGFPFFLWYQLLWIVLGAAVTWVAFLFRRPDEGRDE